MKLKAAIEMLKPEERLVIRARLHARWFDNEPGLLEWWDGCLKLLLVKKTWKAADLWYTVRKKTATPKDLAYLHTRTSALVNCIERHWKQTAFEADHLMQAQCLLRALRTRAWGAEYARKHRDLLNELDQEPLRGMEHYATMLHCQEEHLLAPLMKEELDYSQPLYQGTMDALDRAYMIKRLSLACKAISQDQTLGTQHTLRHLPAVLDPISIGWVDESDPESEPILHLYRLMYALVSASPEKGQPAYLAAKAFFMRHREALKDRPAGELQDLSAYLINYAVLRMNGGETSYKAEVVLLYQWLLEEKVLESDGWIEPANYRNAFLILSQTGDSTAVDRLLNDYGKRVAGETGKALLRFCRGMHAYHKRDWEGAVQHLEGALAHLGLRADDRLEAEIRGMLVRAAFDNGDLAAAKERLKGLKRLLGSVTWKAEGKKQFERFLQAATDLFAVLASPPEKQKQPLERQWQELQGSTLKCFAKKWLVSTLESLVKNRR